MSFSQPDADDAARIISTPDPTSSTAPTRPISKILNLLLGRPLAMEEEEEQKVGPLPGVSMLGLDGLGSASYGPEAALTVLIPLGVAASGYALGVFGAIVAVLALLYLSYRQVMVVYPEGGGSFTVARENLGPLMGLVAAAALLVDYVLAVAVGVAAGVGALVSMVPSLHPYVLWLSLGVLLLVTVVNLRGIRESGLAFVIPTYLFLGSMAIVIAIGIFKTIASGGHPEPLYRSEHPEAAAMGVVSLWLLMRSFASGCTALTGIEAVSNGMTAFAEPKVRNAQWTLGIIVAGLGGITLGLGFLCRAYEIRAIHPESPLYNSIVSQVVSAVVGRNWFYFVTVGSTLAILSLSANTGFADFPRLCRMLAERDYLPHAFAHRGRRLVHNVGILIIAGLGALLLIFYRGFTDHLVPLFATGAFLAFSLSQAGMVRYWLREGVRDFRLVINVLGFLGTAGALVVILIANFANGAWIAVLAVVFLVATFELVHRYYKRVHADTHAEPVFEAAVSLEPLVLVTMKRWDRVSAKALRFALRLSTNIRVVHVARDEEDAEQLVASWKKVVAPSLERRGVPVPTLELAHSKYRKIGRGVLNVINRLENEEPGRPITVVVPELVQLKWWQYLLHNQSALALRTSLVLSGRRKIAIMTVPYYVGEPSDEPSD